MTRVLDCKPCSRGGLVHNWVEIFADPDMVDELVWGTGRHEQVVEADIARFRAGAPASSRPAGCSSMRKAE